MELLTLCFIISVLVNLLIHFYQTAHLFLENFTLGPSQIKCIIIKLCNHDAQSDERPSDVSYIYGKLSLGRLGCLKCTRSSGGMLGSGLANTWLL